MSDNILYALSKNIDTLTQEYVKLVFDKPISLFEINSIKNEITYFILYNMNRKNTDSHLISFKLSGIVNKSQEIGGLMNQIYRNEYSTVTKDISEFATLRIQNICKNQIKANVSDSYFQLLISKFYA